MPTKKIAPAPTANPAQKLAAASSLAMALAPAPPPPSALPGKMGTLVDLLQRPQGATIADMMAATDWQQHSIRGALAGVLKKKGYEITSEKPADVRIYKIAPPPQAKAAPRKRASTQAG